MAVLFLPAGQYRVTVRIRQYPSLSREWPGGLDQVYINVEKVSITYRLPFSFLRVTIHTKQSLTLHPLNT